MYQKSICFYLILRWNVDHQSLNSKCGYFVVIDTLPQSALMLTPSPATPKKSQIKAGLGAYVRARCLTTKHDQEERVRHLSELCCLGVVLDGCNHYQIVLETFQSRTAQNS